MSRRTHDAPTVALPENRQLDVLAQLLERRDVAVVRCPMVAIKDAPDSMPVEQWLERFCEEPPDLFVIYTGEGLDRLLGFAARAGLDGPFVERLRETDTLVRGPKPTRALRRLGLKPTKTAVRPTTEGVIASLREMDIDHRRVAVQLYGSEPNEELMAYLRSRGIEPDCVAPYVYASASDDGQVISLIHELSAGAIDAIAFTSKAQVERLRKVAVRARLETELASGLQAVIVAAVGPVVAEELRESGVRVDVMPDEDYFMKPLVTELVDKLAATSRS
jgi:uroporphyrinogen-III synthase